LVLYYDIVSQNTRENYNINRVALNYYAHILHILYSSVWYSRPPTQPMIKSMINSRRDENRCRPAEGTQTSKSREMAAIHNTLHSRTGTHPVSTSSDHSCCFTHQISQAVGPYGGFQKVFLILNSV